MAKTSLSSTFSFASVSALLESSNLLLLSLRGGITLLNSIAPIMVIFVTIESEHPEQPLIQPPKHWKQHLSPKTCAPRGENWEWRVADRKPVGNREAGGWWHSSSLCGVKGSSWTWAPTGASPVLSEWWSVSLQLCSCWGRGSVRPPPHPTLAQLDPGKQMFCRC